MRIGIDPTSLTASTGWSRKEEDTSEVYISYLKRL